MDVFTTLRRSVPRRLATRRIGVPPEQGATIVDALVANGTRHPERTAMRHREASGEWMSTTWGQYLLGVRQVAAGLAELGVAPGERVAILGANRPEWHLADLGAMANGCVTVPLYPTSSGEQIAYLCGHAHVVACFVDSHAQLGRLLEVRDQLPALRHLVVAEGARRAPLAARYALLGVAGATALAVVALHPSSAPLWWVVAVTLATASVELLVAIDAALWGTSDVVASAERLETLDRPRPSGRLAVPARLDLEACDLDYREAGRAVLTGASLHVGPGARLAVVGPSGVGKSSLLRLLARLDHPDAGTIRLGGVDLADLDEVDLRRRVAYVPSEPGLVTGYARDVVALGRPVAEEGLRLLGELGLALSSTERVEGLSRGETARVALARALAGQPDLVILDEPTAGLDPGATALVLGALERSGAGVVVATHDPAVARWCEDVLELREGRLAPLTR